MPNRAHEYTAVPAAPFLCPHASPSRLYRLDARRRGSLVSVIFPGKGVRMHQTAKPVGKCYGCGLNLGERCGIFENPHAMWQTHSVCPGFQNAELLAAYQESIAHKDIKVRKERRRLVAKMRRDYARHTGDRHVLMAAQH
jgi:hypothetical protein